MCPASKLYRSVKCVMQCCYNNTFEYVPIILHTLSPSPTDCPAGQTPRFSKSPGPTCENPNPAEEQTESFKCFCPDGMLIKMDGSCVLPVDCIGRGNTLHVNVIPVHECN